MTITDTTLASKYRPKRLKDIIGHTSVVTRLQGMLNQDEIPGVVLFTGNTSVGKTTLAYCLASEINGIPYDKQTDLKFINGSSDRGIDEIRSLIQLSRFSPARKKRIIIIDEVQGILSNAPAAAALLAPLENASKTNTVWILCSMDPSKFNTANGKAIANRSIQFLLQPPDKKELVKQAYRIIKGEKMSYITKDILKYAVHNCNHEFRTLANLLQALRDYYEGLTKKPKQLDIEDVSDILSTTESSNDSVIKNIIIGTLSGNFSLVQKNLLDVNDYQYLMNQLLWACEFLINVKIAKVTKHKAVWWSTLNRELINEVNKLNSIKVDLGMLHSSIVDCKLKAASFSVPEKSLLISTFYKLIIDGVSS